MAINGISNSNLLLGQSILNLKSQFEDLQNQLASGKKSTLYSGIGPGEGFAIFARSQLSNISAFTTSINNVNTSISLASTALQSFDKTAGNVRSAAQGGDATILSSGQSVGQESALSQLHSLQELLNTQAGDRFLFSGSATDTPAVVPADQILNGSGAAAGLKQLITERNQADLGANGLGRLVITGPTVLAPTKVLLTEDVAGSPFGFKLNAISSSLTGSAVTGPTGSPSALSVDLGPVNPGNGEKVTFTFNLPDGTTEPLTLTASSASGPLPPGSFAIGATSAATATNLSAALNTALGTLAGTSLTAASAVKASDDFFNWSVVGTGNPVNNQAAVPAAPITGTTALSGVAPSDSLTTSFAVNDTIDVNGTLITFVASGAVGNQQINITDDVQTLLSKIDALSGTATASTISAGAITLNGPVGGWTVTSAAAGFAALGLTSPINTVVATGSAVNNNAAVPAAPIGGATALSGVAPSDSLSTSFAVNDTITVNGTPITFVAAGAVGNQQINITDNLQTLLSKIDALSGTTTPSTISNGAITLHGGPAGLTVTSASAAFTALGFPAAGVSAARSPLRVNGPPFNTATSVTSGTPANTVYWYTGENGLGSARATSLARIDQTTVVQYGVRANETAIRTVLQNVAVFAAFSTSPANPNGSALITALKQRVSTNLLPNGSQQRVSDIETDLANTQLAAKNVTSQQTQSKLTLQNIIDQTETISTDQVASELLAVQNSLEASYRTTSILSQLTLTKFLA